MTIISYNKILASEGYVLTNGKAYGHKVALAENDSIENWYEITEAEYEEILAKEEEEFLF